MTNHISMLAVAITCFVGLGCASSAAKQAETPAPQDKGKPTDVDTTDDKDKGSGDVTCKDATSASVLRDLSIAVRGEKSSLCNSLLKEPESTTAMVLYITSPTCVSCKATLADLSDWVEDFGGIKLVVAVPTAQSEFLEAYSESEIKEFVDGLAPNATAATDPSGKAWLTLSKDPKQPHFPLVIAFDRAGKRSTFNADAIDSVELLKANLYPKLEVLAQP